jgi:prepilin-type N-terminal cleavage/methylation domain-containing protein
LSRGFTLLEILIVIIIVGVLAAVALPSYFSHIEGARGTEAAHTVGIIRRAIQACYSQSQDFTSCINWNALGMNDPGLDPASHFVYTLGQSGAPGCDYYIEVRRNSVDNPNWSGSLTSAMTAGSYNGALFMCAGAPYSGVRTSNCPSIPSGCIP